MNYKEQQQMRDRMKEVERLVRIQEASNLEIKTLLETLAARISALESPIATKKNDDSVRPPPIRYTRKDDSRKAIL